MFTMTQHPTINRMMTCPHCLGEYELGLTGTVSGCDKCEGIIRTPSGMIDYAASTPEIFVKREAGQNVLEYAILILLVTLIVLAFLETVKLAG